MRATVRRQQTPFAILLFALLLLTALERRLAEIDFNSTGVVRVENGEKVDGDEIFNRLVYVDDLATPQRSEEHTSELQSQSNLVCRLLLEKKKKKDDECVIIITDIHTTTNGYVGSLCSVSTA